MADKTRIAYVVSTLGNSGPTRQLSYIASGLDADRFHCRVITLSPEPRDSLSAMYGAPHIELKSLGLGRLQGQISGRRRLAQVLDDYQPDIVHTQGLRADRLASLLRPANWVATARNYPFDDYPMKFGRMRGWLMALEHMAAFRHCANVVACSDSIALRLGNHRIPATVIHNGVPVRRDAEPGSVDWEKDLKFVVSGALIERKNVAYVLGAFADLGVTAAPLQILGDGPERSMLERLAPEGRAEFLGHVPNVTPHIGPGRIIISASKSEGMPNAILEGFAAGCPALLSDIPAHREVYEMAPGATALFSLNDGGEELRRLVTKVHGGQLTFEPQAIHAAAVLFSAETMSGRYQCLYQRLCNG